MKTRTAMCILAIASTHTAFGSLILSSANFVSGTGLGTEPTLLTIQDSPTEIGCVGSTSSQIGSTFNASGVCGGSSGDVKTGASQTAPQTIGTITANTFGIVFNADQPAGGPITLTGHSGRIPVVRSAPSRQPSPRSAVDIAALPYPPKRGPELGARLPKEAD
jgi:hypothetical protein